MPATSGVLLVYLSEAPVPEAVQQPDHSRPETAVNECDLSGDEATHKDVGGIAESPCRMEDLMRGGVSPPTSPDGLASDELGDTGNRSASRLQ